MSICTNGFFENIPPPIPTALPPGLYLQNRVDYNFFDRVQSINSNVSTIRSNFPDKAGSYTYYVFASYAEITSFKNGRILHITAYPTSNWDVVLQN